MCRVNITGGECPQEEINAYIARGSSSTAASRTQSDIRLDLANTSSWRITIRISRLTASAASRATWSARSTASTTPSAPRRDRVKLRHHAAITLSLRIFACQFGQDGV